MPKVSINHTGLAIVSSRYYLVYNRYAQLVAVGAGKVGALIALSSRYSFRLRTWGVK